MGVQKDPVVLNVPNHLVYEPHAYIRQNDRFERRAGYIYSENIAPLWVGEFGWNQGGDDEWNWYKDFVTYLENSKTQSSAPWGHGHQLGLLWLDAQQ